MLLREMPTKMSERIRRSVTWADVEGAVPSRPRLRRILARLSNRGWSALNVRAAELWARKGSSP